MSITIFARCGAAAVCLLSMSAGATSNYGITFSDKFGNGSGYGSPVPFAMGSTDAGGSAGKNLVSAYAQTSQLDTIQTGAAYGNSSTENSLDLSGLAINRLSLHYALQVSGIDAGFGSATTSDFWSLTYGNSAGFLVGLIGSRSIDANGKVTQGVQRYDGTGVSTLYSKRFSGTFNYDLVVNPLETSFPDIYAAAGCQIARAPASGGYCAVNLGFGIAPRPPVKQAAFATRFAGRELDSTVASVPEPGSWALLAAGFGIVGAASRRRGRAVVAA